MILVVGAAGHLGRRICAELLANGERVRGLVRATSNAETVAALRAQGAELVEGDLRDPASLGAACAGVAALICTASAVPFTYTAGENDIETTDRAGVKNLVDAATRAGIGHFVYTSFSGNLDGDFPLCDAKREAEQHLIGSGMTYTILRPSCFMEVWLSPVVGFDPANGTAVMYGDGSRPVSYISGADVAAFAVGSLTAPGAQNAVLELGGPEALSQLQAVQTFEEVLGRRIQTQFIPEEALEAQRAAATDGMQRSLAGLMLCLAEGDEVDSGPALRAIPILQTSVKAFAQSQN